MLETSATLCEVELFVQKIKHRHQKWTNIAAIAALKCTYPNGLEWRTENAKRKNSHLVELNHHRHSLFHHPSLHQCLCFRLHQMKQQF